MSGNLQDTIILDPKRFNPQTRKWNVPVLAIGGLTLTELHIDGELIRKGEYSIENNMIDLNKSHNINSKTKSYIIVQYNPSNILLKFWLPIILAGIGLVGTLASPIGYQLNLLYQPPLEIRAKSWGYDDERHAFTMTIYGNNIKISDSKYWRLHVAVRQLDKSKDAHEDVYKYLSGPFMLKDLQDVVVYTNEEMTKEYLEGGYYLQACIFKSVKEVKLQMPFKPREYMADSLEMISCNSIGYR